jgi:hypothetical protein
MADSPLEQLAEEIDAHCRSHGREWHAEMTAGSDCFWACKLTVVLTPYRDDGPDRSLVAYVGAGEGPEGAFRSAWDDMRAWLGAFGRETTEEADG